MKKIARVGLAILVLLFVARTEYLFREGVQVVISPALSVLGVLGLYLLLSGQTAKASLGLSRIAASLLVGWALAYAVSPALGSVAAVTVAAVLVRVSAASPSGRESVSESRPPDLELAPWERLSTLVVGPDPQSASSVAFYLAAKLAKSPARVVIIDANGVAVEELASIEAPFVRVGPEEIDLMCPTAPEELYHKAAQIVSLLCGGNSAVIAKALRNRSLDRISKDLTSPAELRILAEIFSGGERFSVIDLMPKYGALVVDLSSVEPLSVREAATLLVMLQAISAEFPLYITAAELSFSLALRANWRLKREVIDVVQRVAKGGLILSTDSTADPQVWDIFSAVVVCPGIRVSWSTAILGGLRTLKRDLEKLASNLGEDEVLVIWGRPPKHAVVRIK